jgi:hypothetical protein
MHYLGHIISDGAMSMDGDKISAVQAWPRPCSIKALRGFLSLTGYYRHFITNYGAIAAPLTTLLKEAFLLTPEATAAFDALKVALTHCSSSIATLRARASAPSCTKGTAPSLSSVDR